MGLGDDEEEVGACGGEDVVLGGVFDADEEEGSCVGFTGGCNTGLVVFEVEDDEGGELAVMGGEATLM